MASTTVLVDPATVLGKRRRPRYLLQLTSSPEPPALADERRASSSKTAPPIIVNGSLVLASTKRRYQCTHDGCNKVYTKPSRLEEHERSHSGNRPFVCETCDKSYLRETHLQAHSRSHLPHSERPFVCTESNCAKRFWTSQHLRTHVDWHNGAKPFECSEDDCHQSFAKHHQLLSHKCSEHAPPGSKPYRCNHKGCIQSFSTNQHLRTHAKVHNVKRYTCAHPSCISSNDESIIYFQTWTALQHHNRTVHPPTCPYPSCEGKTFTAQKGLRAHFKLHEQQMIEAELTGALSDDDERPPKKKRRGGEVGRDWVCGRDGCSKDFKSKKAMTTHVNITHLGRRDFECSHEGCDQKFGYKHLLQRHLAKHTAPTSSSDDSDDTSPKAPDLTIDIVTGQAYAHSAEKKLESFQAIQCPFPKLDGLGLVRVSSSKLTCAYVFNRAYDFRRHLQSAHDITVEKDVATSWVQRHRVSLLA